MTTPYDADVIIAGAGMAGATLGLALARAGLKPILIDPVVLSAQTAPSFDGRSSAIAFAAFRQWRSLGLAPALEPLSQRIEQILVTDGRAPGPLARGPGPFFLRFDSEEIADRSGGEPLGYMLENRHTRAALAQALETAGVEVLAPARVTSARFDARAAEVALADGRTLSAPLVVGAEGRGSVIREAAGIGALGWPYRQAGVVATVKLERPHNGVAHEYFLPSGPFAILPLTDDRASLVWTESERRAAALRSARPEVFHAHLQRRFGDLLGRAEVEGQVFTYPLSLQLAERLTGPRAALLGDAAHGVHPIAGQGLNLGLRDVAALAEVVADAARLGLDIGSGVTLARYERWRRTDAAMSAAAFDALNGLFSNDWTLLRTARDAGLRLIDRMPGLKQLLVTEAAGLTGEVPKLLRGEPV